MVSVMPFKAGKGALILHTSFVVAFKCYNIRELNLHTKNGLISVQKIYFQK